jgi:hypothetical protein
MRIIIAVLLMFVSIVSITACSSSKLSEDDARTVLENKIKNDQTKDCVKLLNLKKINGMEASPFGTKIYYMEFEANLVTLKNCTWSRMYFTAYPVNINSRIYDKTGMIAANTTFKTTGRIAFVKTENGWSGNFQAD